MLLRHAAAPQPTEDPAAPSRDAPALNAYAGITAWVKASLPADFDYTAELAVHLRTMRLIDGGGRFAVAALADRSLLAPFDPHALVDAMARAAAQNPYLSRFVARARERTFGAFQREDRASVIPSAVAYAALLDRLTRALYDDWRVLREVYRFFVAEKKRTDLAGVLNAFERAKVASVDAVMGSDLRMHERGEVSPRSGRVILPLNIAEAVAEDVRLGFRDNARAGLTMILHGPGGRAANPRTGRGPSAFSAERRAIVYGLPLAHRWADLYSTWNLAFVSHYAHFPFVFAKLLTPAVGAYQSRPEEYMYNRRIALFVHLHWGTFGRVDGRRAAMDWSDRELTSLWAACNRESARAFESELALVDPSLANRAKNRAARLLDGE